jgi:multicomponent Na+:H+ antiporter subunit E
MRSLLGGVDVARRALHPDLPIAPGLIEYPLRLPPGLPQVFMANTVSLLPGTLSAALDRSVLTVHVLDRRTGFLADLKTVEQSVARLFGASLEGC